MDAATPSSQRLALALHSATALIDRVADAYLRPAHGIGLATFAALVTIDAMGPARQNAIADALGVSRAAVTQRLAALDARGLVHSSQDATDRRANLVRLSAAGEQLLAAAWKGLARHDDGLEDDVDLVGLQEALDTLIANATRHLATRAAQ